MQLKRVAEAKLPTPWGDFLMVGFEELATDRIMSRWYMAIYQGSRRSSPAYIQSV